MDNNDRNDKKDAGSNFALWLPGSAVIISLVVSTFALTREPFLEARPAGAQLQVEQPIEARLWQDPFDALERHRKKHKDSENPGSEFVCNEELFSKLNLTETAEKPLPPPSIMVALVSGGPYADEVEMRRRIRYAVLAGLKNAQMVPEDEQHLRCLTLAKDLALAKDISGKKLGQVEIPYETFVANPFDPPTDLNNNKRFDAQTILFWVKEEDLDTEPLQRLENLHDTLSKKLGSNGPQPNSNQNSQKKVLKVIGPSTSTILRYMYLEEAKDIEEKKNNKNTEKEDKLNIEIYSPLATAEEAMLKHGIAESSASETGSQQKQPESPTYKMKLLRTVSDDGVLTRLLLEELKRRRVDPVLGLRCSEKLPDTVGSLCDTTGGGRLNRIALVSEWDSFYSRAFAETFKENIVKGIENTSSKAKVDDWVLQFSYLRGLDGLLPEEAASGKKSSDNKENNQRGSSPLDIGSPERADGNSQLDYLRRLAEHIAERDETYRRNGESGIGAIGVLGTDAYDKLLVLQALKSRMPNKVFFSTNLDARLLQRGQAETVRNLVLAAPYGLALARELQQDVPPFRDSLQSAVFVAVQVAQASGSFDEKQEVNFNEKLSPGIYEVGIRGFISLKSSHANVCEALEREPWRATGDYANANTKPDIMQLSCLQDEPLPPYPELSDPTRDKLDRALSMWWTKPLLAILVVLAIFLGWWWTEKDHSPTSGGALPHWTHNLPLALYVAATLSALFAIWLWSVEFMWTTFLLILPGIICSQLNRGVQRSPSHIGGGLFDSSAYYIVMPIVVFLLAVVWAYQERLSLTEEGLGEPMFLFEGISAWPTLGLRLLAVLISISALAWGWRSLRINRAEIEASYRLHNYSLSLWRYFPHFGHDDGQRRTFREWLVELGNFLFRIFFPLSSTSIAKPQKKATDLPSQAGSDDVLDFENFWKEHCISGTFGARMLRAILATWIFVVATSVLYVLWPMEGTPIRGEWEPPTMKLSWMVPTLAFQLLVFWVVDANRLLVQFIRQLSSHRIRWPNALQMEHEKIFGIREHPCIDAWVDMTLIAQRTAAVNRLIYIPTAVLLILIMSRSSVFDNWPTPPSLVISFLLTALVLFVAALSLRRAAEKARGTALAHIDEYLLKTPANEKGYEKFRLIRERIAALNTGAFSRYSEEPLVRALLLSLAGIGGSAIVEVLNYSKF